MQAEEEEEQTLQMVTMMQLQTAREHDILPCRPMLFVNILPEAIYLSQVRVIKLLRSVAYASGSEMLLADWSRYARN